MTTNGWSLAKGQQAGRSAGPYPKEQSCLAARSPHVDIPGATHSILVRLSETSALAIQ